MTKGAVLIDAEGNVARPDGAERQYSEAVLHYTGVIPPEPGSPVDAPGQQVPSSPHAMIVGAGAGSGGAGRDQVPVVARGGNRANNNKPRDELSSLSEGKDDLVVESLPSDDPEARDPATTTGSAYSSFPMSYGADAQSPARPFYYYTSAVDPRSPVSAAGGDGTTPMTMMYVPSSGVEGGASGPVLMPFAFPPGAAMDPQLFREVVAPPVEKPSENRLYFNFVFVSPRYIS